MSSNNLGTAGASETTPLIADRAADATSLSAFEQPQPAPHAASKTAASSWLSPYRRVLIATFFLSVSFVFTATPLLYSFRTMECEDYYLVHDAPPAHVKDRCAVKDVEAATAQSISTMVIFTTFSGFLNLLVTTYEIKHWGVRAALVQQTAWPCIRNLFQILGISKGGRFGINLIQGTQLITILGGGAGYMLSANSYIAEVVDAEARTGAFGVLAGVAMAGTATGFTLGGLAGDLISPVAPFQITFCLLVASTLFTGFFLPYIPPTAAQEGDKKTSVGGMLGCLAVFIPRKAEGRRGRYWGLTLLGLGAFLGVLATAFVPLMLQLTSTNRYAFTPATNGYLMSLNSLARALFLTLAFPRIIAKGRAWFSQPSSSSPLPSDSTSRTPTLVDAPQRLATDAEDYEPPSLLDEMEEPVSLAPTDKVHGSAFDLSFLRWSMMVDALLTGLVAFNRNPREMFMAGLILPLASGTAPACKGVMMELVSAEQRADALSAISLLETAAFIITGSLFGIVFAWLSDIGRPNDVYFFNGGLALLAGFVLMAVRFPRASQSSSAA